MPLVYWCIPLFLFTTFIDDVSISTVLRLCYKNANEWRWSNDTEGKLKYLYLEKNLFQCHFVHQKAYVCFFFFFYFFLCLLLTLPLFLLLPLPLIILTLPFFLHLLFFSITPSYSSSYSTPSFSSSSSTSFFSSSSYYYMEPQVRRTKCLSTRLEGIFGLGIGPLQGPSLQITTQTQNKRRHTFIPRAGFWARTLVFERLKRAHTLDRSADVVMGSRTDLFSWIR
jgi:hypothetical protein